jgi:predicted metal-dependent phosphotriesterase family hydrolase
LSDWVESVTGPVRADALGVTLPHEHLQLDMFRGTRRLDLVLDDVDLAVSELADFTRVGGATMLEVTPPGIGRSPAALREISVKSGIQVLMGTGRYRETYYEPDLWTRSTADVAREFIQEIEDGVDASGSRIRPAFIGEIGVDGYHISPIEERVHRAAGRAQRQTGRPITTHSLLSAVGLQQLDVFKEEGADLRRIAVGHSDSFPDLDYYEAIISRGSFVQFDLVRGTVKHETQLRIRFIRELVRRGHIQHILISHDVCSRQHLRAYGGRGYSYVPGEFADDLMTAGLSTDSVSQILVENPRRLLTGTT